MIFRLLIAVLFCSFFQVVYAGEYSETQNDRVWGSSTTGIGKGLLLAKRLDVIEPKIQKLFPGKKIKVFTIDLNSDGRVDYIVPEDKAFRTCFVDADFKLRSCEKLGIGDGFAYYFFAKLDNEPMLKLFELSGDSDESDYKLYSFDPKTWKLNLVFKIYPYIYATDKDHKGVYWGYPWDITGITLKNDKGEIKFLGISGKDKDEATRKSVYENKILFNGIPTQGHPYTKLQEKFKLMSLKEMIVLNKHKKPTKEAHK